MALSHRPVPAGYPDPALRQRSRAGEWRCARLPGPFRRRQLPARRAQPVPPQPTHALAHGIPPGVACATPSGCTWGRRRSHPGIGASSDAARILGTVAHRRGAVRRPAAVPVLRCRVDAVPVSGRHDVRCGHVCARLPLASARTTDAANRHPRCAYLESLVCLPCALNVLRKASTRIHMAEDLLDIARPRLSAAQLRAATEQILRRIDEGIESAETGTPEWQALTEYRGRLLAGAV